MVGICYANDKTCVFTEGRVPTEAEVEQVCEKISKARVYLDTGFGGAPIEPPPISRVIKLNRHSGTSEIEDHGELAV